MLESCREQIATLEGKKSALEASVVALELEYRKKREELLAQNSELEAKIKKINDKKELLECRDFKAKRLLNFEEQDIFNALIFEFLDTKKVTLATQVALSAFVSVPKEQKTLWYQYNKYYVDFLVLKKKFEPLFAVEYNGGGHNGAENTLERDETKQIVLNLAKIPLIVVSKFESKNDLRAHLSGSFDDAIAKYGLVEYFKGR